MIDFMHSCEKIEMPSDLSFLFSHSFIDQQLVHRSKVYYVFEISHTLNPSDSEVQSNQIKIEFLMYNASWLNNTKHLVQSGNQMMTFRMKPLHLISNKIQCTCFNRTTYRITQSMHLKLQVTVSTAQNIFNNMPYDMCWEEMGIWARERERERGKRQFKANRHFIEMKSAFNITIDSQYLSSHSRVSHFIYFSRSAVKCMLCIDMHLNSDFGRFDKSLHILCKIVPLFSFQHLWMHKRTAVTNTAYTTTTAQELEKKINQ